MQEYEQPARHLAVVESHGTCLSCAVLLPQSATSFDSATRRTLIGLAETFLKERDHRPSVRSSVGVLAFTASSASWDILDMDVTFQANGIVTMTSSFNANPLSLSVILYQLSWVLPILVHDDFIQIYRGGYIRRMPRALINWPQRGIAIKPIVNRQPFNSVQRGGHQLIKSYENIRRSKEDLCNVEEDFCSAVLQDASFLDFEDALHQAIPNYGWRMPI
ncbi:hypothetical protein [Sulfobacillus thermosulfidooxidans]|uniref:hypothetical protein n=1 Tax=Sulfobacillus thermosulfidooxidans TaxID=28034 RepID=UPI0006B45742|nr:hypothetical protein [Sulfobacillus thermosulfidooxidans]